MSTHFVTFSPERVAAYIDGFNLYHGLADHLRSIRWSLSVLAAISSCTVAAAVLAFFWWAMTSSS